MRRIIVLSALIGVGVLGLTAASGSAANGKASCNGILVSSTAGNPGLVAEVTRYYHGVAKDLGYPPGLVADAPGAHAHLGSVVGCLAGLGG
jgi:hypothetical protein